MPEPALSVVVPSVNGWGDLEGCLAALDSERAATPLEVLVPERCGEPVRARVAKHFPWVQVIPVPDTTTIPKMRALAFAAARAPSVAVIEDHVLVGGGWAHSLLLARQSAQVVGGGIVNAATERLVDWAAFLCEYSHMLPPLPTGSTDWITGNNTVYDRNLLVRMAPVIAEGRWEDHLHTAIRAAGIDLIMRPDIVVAHKKHYTVGEYFTQRFLYARGYAGMRVAAAGRGRRILFGTAAVALPAVLLGRTAMRLLRKGVARDLVWRCLPLLALFVTSWGAGEVIGYWFGPGGSLAKVR